ncbi:diguanylate cyclase (GGDEF)-like protein [Methylohalomonas lacus]|uniref:Diguanylate cyclase (GGDEF)-like protein n=1 Tax=Methylohalomonas lacus TaxID=398773 RepID=A0AAE3HHJ8_9GAMM|nr:EAL domain-containing protein [Methylohalomonas lacus]MCS3902451.1 diguanylate cyclase (GGDEF)-like protein [Methylohalomonas lacus]
MRLVRLSTYSIVASFIGLVALLALSIYSYQSMRSNQREVDTLLELKQRVDNFSVASDSLLLFGADPKLWQVIQQEGRSIRAALESLSEKEETGTGRVAHHIDIILRELESAIRPDQWNERLPSVESEQGPGGPLNLSERNQIILNQIASHGIALDSALARAMHAQQQARTQQVVVTTVAFAATALLFGALCVATFGLIHRRLNRPTRQLVNTIERVRNGDIYARVVTNGDDELASLGQAFNDLLDEQQRTYSQLLEHEQILQRSKDELAYALDLRQTLINSLSAHIALLDQDGTVIDVNDQWRHFGQENDYKDNQFGIGQNYISVCETAHGDCAKDAQRVAEGLRAILAGEQDIFALEYACHSPQEQRWFRVMINRLTPGQTDSSVYGAVVMHVDITERKLAELELNRLAFEDALTHLWSRTGFINHLAEHFQTQGWQFGGRVVLLDIVQLHDINDAYGYSTGDLMLNSIARRLQARVGDQGFVGRTGGDEFVVYLQGGANPADGWERQLLNSVFAEPFHVEHAPIYVEAQFGFTRLETQPRSAENLVREAELALFYCRRRGLGDNWAAYNHTLDSESQDRLRLTRELRLALDNDEFELHFQPKVSLANGAIIGCEALLRWHHPERGLQPPASFIPVAEKSQLIRPIGRWVLNEACRYLSVWRDAGLGIVNVSLNVSMVQFTESNFSRTVAEALAAHDVPPQSLTLEITESVFDQESEQLREEIIRLHELGVNLSLDDFGTGYSSLRYLQQYPFDEIKIDQSFTRKLLDDAYSECIVNAILDIAKALGAEAVAEGVENEQMRSGLMALGCRNGQGYYYSVPLEVEDFRWLLDKRRTLPLAAHHSNSSIELSRG